MGKVGYEINFNRYFYQYQPPRPLEDYRGGHPRSGEGHPGDAEGGGGMKTATSINGIRQWKRYSSTREVRCGVARGDSKPLEDKATEICLPDQFEVGKIRGLADDHCSIISADGECGRAWDGLNWNFPRRCSLRSARFTYFRDGTCGLPR